MTIRNLSGRGWTSGQPYAHMSLIHFVLVIGLLSIPFQAGWLTQNDGYENNLETFGGLIDGVRMPTATLNYRTSAHFLEINSIYSAEMMRRVNF
jgi:hypothetical protein